MKNNQRERDREKTKRKGRTKQKEYYNEINKQTKKETQRKKKMLLQSKIRAKHTKCKKCKLNITQNNKMHAKQPTNTDNKRKKR